MKALNLSMPLNRPQYVPASEGYLSLLAWSLFPDANPKVDGLKKAYRYRFEMFKQSKGLKIVRTDAVSDNRLSEFGQLLEKNGLITAEDSQLLASAVSSSLVGVSSKKSNFRPSAPVSLALALAQNKEGIHASSNPPAIAEILESIYAIGSPSQPAKSLAAVWFAASKHRLEQDHLLNAIDKSFLELNFPEIGEPTIPSGKDDESIQSWREITTRSPFTWFAKSWNTLCSDAWVEALPARTWTDWATTLLRTAYGLAFLWESAWYEALARVAVSDKEPSVSKIIDRMNPVLPWRSSASTAEIKDVASKIKARCQTAFKVNAILDDMLRKFGGSDMQADEFLSQIANDESSVGKLKLALQAEKNQDKVAKGLREAIRYALVTREDSGSTPDHYGLLNSAGSRWLFVQPGIEWVAVMASLAGGEPRKGCTLGDLRDFLREAGLDPDKRDLIQLLEEAGLARGSADSDDGLYVESAF